MRGAQLLGCKRVTHLNLILALKLFQRFPKRFKNKSYSDTALQIMQVVNVFTFGQIA